MTDRRGETVNYATPEQIEEYNDSRGWGGPAVDLPKEDPWKELQAWEDKHQTVVFITANPTNIREYFDDSKDEELFENVTDAEIYAHLQYVCSKMDLGFEHSAIMDWVKDEIQNDVETNKQNTNPAWGSASTTME